MVEPTELVYASTYSILLGIEMTTIVPEGEGYVFFQIQHARPNGLIFDPQTGSWPPTVLSAATEVHNHGDEDNRKNGDEDNNSCY